jgi:hypothetical protein
MAVLAGEARTARARVFAVALACLAVPASASAQVPDVGATAASLTQTAATTVAQASNTAAVEPTVPQAVPPAPVERAAEPVRQVTAKVREVGRAAAPPAAPVIDSATRSVEEVTAQVARTVNETVAAGPGPSAPSRPSAPVERRNSHPAVDPPTAPFAGLFAPLASIERTVDSLALPVPAFAASPVAGSTSVGVIERRSPDSPVRQGPAHSGPQLPSAPSGAASAAPAGVMFAAFLALFGAAALLLAGTARRLQLQPAAMRPAPFVALLERPG